MINWRCSYPKYLSLPFCINSEVNHRLSGFKKTILCKTKKQKTIKLFVQTLLGGQNRCENKHQPSICFSQFGSHTKHWSCGIFQSVLCSSVAPFIIYKNSTKLCKLTNLVHKSHGHQVSGAHLVEDVEVPLIGWLTGHPGLLQQVRLHWSADQQLSSGCEVSRTGWANPLTGCEVMKSGRCHWYLFICSWMYFPKRLLLLLRSVQALPGDKSAPMNDSSHQ